MHLELKISKIVNIFHMNSRAVKHAECDGSIQVTHRENCNWFTSLLFHWPGSTLQRPAKFPVHRSTGVLPKPSDGLGTHSRTKPLGTGPWRWRWTERSPCARRSFRLVPPSIYLGAAPRCPRPRARAVVTHSRSGTPSNPG